MTLGFPPPTEAITWAGTIAVAVVTAALSLQKVMHIWAKGSTDLNSTQGENQVVTLLRSELERAYRQNTNLETKIDSLEADTSTLVKQNHTLIETVVSLEKHIQVITRKLGD